ncbi:MAG: methanol--corrinoid methyltransferase, partial [Calditrichia bacterium]|nr:methanol--corrinoid methyltransferase [Calditrichia bacterium]
LTIGGGQVYPEINFTLPTMEIKENTHESIFKQYSEIIDTIVKRSEILKVPGLVIEFEQLPPMTSNPQLGGEITKLLRNRLNDCDIPNALRVTVVDLRDGDRPPLLRQGKNWEQMKEAFIVAAQAGADILSIESVGGKEVHDQALLYGDLNGIIGSLGILAYKDMEWLWNQITEIASQYNVIPGGDTACGFSNTAMQLAGKGMLPSLLAALDRAASVPRSLAAYENGAVGPSKDCAYEGPFIKAITGYPISMEGKSSSCAHFSHLGNIASATADLWSNESVQNIRLLSGSAPEVFLEILAYDCRLMNIASQNNEALKMRDWLVESDSSLNVEAFILKPESVVEISKSIVNNTGGYRQTKESVLTTFDIIKNAIIEGKVNISENEKNWIDRFEIELADIIETEEASIEYLKNNYGNLFNLESYGLN